MEELVQLFGLFEQGKSLPGIVVELKVPTAVALEAHRQYELLRAVRVQTGPSEEDGTSTIIEELKAQLEDQARQLASMAEEARESASKRDRQIDSLASEVASALFDQRQNAEERIGALQHRLEEMAGRNFAR